MSWFFAIKYKNQGQNIDPENFLPKNISLKIRNPHMQVFAGGNSSNLYFNSQKENGWVSCGVIISANNDKILNKSDQNLIINKNEINQLNGHYAILKWDKNTFEIYNDKLGIRKFYISETEDCFIVSTRIDWIIKARKVNEIDIGNISTYFGHFTPLTHESYIKGIYKSEPATKVVISNKISKTHVKTFVNLNVKISQIFSDIKSSMMLPIQNGNNISLGLSGGIDSRLLLGYLLGKENWQTHTFGTDSDLDMLQAQELAKVFGFKHYSFNPIISDQMKAIEYCREISYTTDMSLRLIAFDLAERLTWLNNQKMWLIDGGNGGFFRRAMGIRYLKNAEFYSDNHNIDSLFSKPIPKFLDSNFRNSLSINKENHIEKLLDKIPVRKDLGNWIDEIMKKYYMPNQYNSQSLYDQYVSGYMVYAQPNVVNAILEIPSYKKENSKLFYREMQKTAPKLLNIDFVRYNQKVPYLFHKNKYSGYLYAKVKSKFVKNIQNTQSKQLLLLIREFVEDRIHSKSVKECSFYDQKYLENLVSEYYKTYKNADEILKWLSFDFFREIL